MRYKMAKTSILSVLLLGTALLHAQEPEALLRKGFATPPEAAKPQLWWHWMNGNISREGIRLDLEWMQRSGIGGFHNFDAALATPQVVDKRLAYMTPEWKDAFRYAIEEAGRLGLKAAIAGSPGWSESGGPWVSAPEAMKKYVWSELEVTGGKRFSGKLPHPPTNTGAFQSAGIHDVIDAPAGMSKLPEFYADSLVVAFRKAPSAKPLRPKMSSSTGSPNFALLDDGDVQQSALLPIPQAGSSAWIEWDYGQPQIIRSITVFFEDPTGFGAYLAGPAPTRILEASDDGTHFRTIRELKGGDALEHTYSFAPVTARYFRVSFTPVAPQAEQPSEDDAEFDSSFFGINTQTKPTDYKIAELALHPDARVQLFEDKAAFSSSSSLDTFATPPTGAESLIDKASVINLTGQMQPDGTLDWTPPPGDWLILRFGYSLLGIVNHPATKEATGLEVDKLNANYVRKYFNTYLDSYLQAVGPDLMGQRGISAVINDSWEAGSENWTDSFPADFKRLRGYEIAPWLPVLTGRIVESAEASERFLWDFRKTIADLIATEHYATLEDVLHQRHMIHYGESHENGRAYVCDGMEVKKYNEIPMSAMWTQVPGINREQFGFNADDRESASVAHIYGQNLAAAESMTAASAPWGWSPATLRPTLDQELLNGINRVVIHESAHQPLIDKAPGLTLGPFGQWFNRNETWANQASAWITYIARSSFMLQQGRFHADLLYFYGEDSNLTALFANSAPDLPPGYDFDYINADALIHELSVAGEAITTPGGMHYRLLVLDPRTRQISLPVLRSIYKLVEQGATVVGAKPIASPSLADDRDEFTRLNNALFGNGSGLHKLGKGSVYAGLKPAELLATLNLKPDFSYTKPTASTDLRFVHRSLENGSIYFVDNRGNQAQSLSASFRIAGKRPELWHADTGVIEPVSYSIEAGITTIPLHLNARESLFVVFVDDTKQSSLALPAKTEIPVASLNNDWQLSFQPGRGAPASIKLNTLSAWNENPNPGIKYFSGEGTYTHTLEIKPEWLSSGKELWLDLGEVDHLAELTLNGQPLGILWHAPYRVNLTPALKAGSNQLTIKVVNAWVNRLIGDLQPGAQKITFTTNNPYKATSKLRPSGLIGPVQLISVQ